MPDPFKKVQPGEQVEFSATAWNAMLGAGQAFQRSKNVDFAALSTTRSTTIIRVKNTSGSNLDRNTILGLDGPIFTPTDSVNVFLQEVTFKGIVPNIALHRRRYCVLLEPAPQGRVVRAYLAGLCQVNVDIIDPTHEYANIDNANTDNMVSSRFGHARILWKEADEPYGYYSTGLQWAIVMLGVTGSCVAIGKAATDIDPRSGTTFGTGQVDLYRSDGGTVDGPLETIDVLNASADDDAYGVGIAAGKWVSVAWDADDTAWVAPLEC